MWQTDSSPPPKGNDQNFAELPNISEIRELENKLFVQNTHPINESEKEKTEIEPQIVSLDTLDFELVKNTVNTSQTINSVSDNNDLNSRQPSSGSSDSSSEENNSNINNFIEEEVLKSIRNSFNVTQTVMT